MAAWGMESFFAKHQFKPGQRVPRSVRSVQELRVLVALLADVLLEQVPVHRIGIPLDAVLD